MKVVFLQNLEGTAQIGDVKEVADGFGRNYLLPKKIALLATPSAISQAEVQRKVEASRMAKQEAEMVELAKKLEATGITIKMKVGEEGKLFGSVTTADIAKGLLQVANLEVDRRKIEMAEPIKQAGTHEVILRLSKTVAARLKVVVEPEQA